jgi:hypothetical protein
MRRTFGHQALGGHVEQARVAGGGAPPGVDIVLARLGRVDAIGGYAGEAQCLHLVLHERDKRRDDDRQAALHECGHLEAERLARAGRHDRQHVAAREQRVDHGQLARAEVVVAEDVLEDLALAVGGLGEGLHRAGACGSGLYVSRR